MSFLLRKRLLCDRPEADPDCVCWLRRFNETFPPYPRGPVGSHFIEGVYVSLYTANALKEFFKKELARAKKKTGEVRSMDMGTYRIVESPASLPELVKI